MHVIRIIQLFLNIIDIIIDNNIIIIYDCISISISISLNTTIIWYCYYLNYT